MTDLRVTINGRELEATWVDGNPETRAALEAELPVGGDAARWGNEVYFDVPLDVEPADARENVPVGAVAYWPAGNALCVFWGPTPASEDEQPRAASPVAVVAEIEDVSPLEELEGRAEVRVEEA